MFVFLFYVVLCILIECSILCVFVFWFYCVCWGACIFCFYCFVSSFHIVLHVSIECLCFLFNIVLCFD